MRRELTDAWLRGLEPPATGRLEVWDSRVSGLVLRLTPSGVATWSIRGRTAEGKRTRPKLGSWPAMGIADARKRALAAIAEIQAGGDPIAAKRAAQAERARRAGLPTVSARLIEWQAVRGGDKHKPWSDRYAKEVARIVEREIIPALGDRPLSETTRSDWTALVAAKRKTAPAMASLVYRVVASFLGHAEAHGWVASALLPRKGLSSIAPPPTSRGRVLTDEELRAIWIAAGELNPKPRAFVRLAILTAARAMEVADIAAGEIDRATARWTIPCHRAKNRQPITLPLSTAAMTELLAVWPAHDDRAGPEWRLLGDIAGSGLRGFSKLKARLDQLSRVSDWRWHDLRRTARTGMTRLGVPREHAEAALNHVSGRTTLERTYDRHDYAEEVIAALGRWQAHVARLVTAS